MFLKYNLQMNFFRQKLKFLFTLLLCASFSLFAQESSDTVQIDLSKAIEIALSDAPTMRIANRDIEIKKNYKKEQIVSLFPDLSASGSYSRTIQKQKMVMDMGGNSMEIEVGTFNNYSAGLSLSLPIIMPALWKSLELAQTDIDLAQRNAQVSKISVTSQVKQAYYTYLFAKESYQVLKLNYANTELNLKYVTDRYNQDLASEFDKLRAEVQLKNLRPNLTDAEKATKLAEMMLKIVLGMDVNEPVKFVGALSDFESQLMAEIPYNENSSLANNKNMIQMDFALKQLDLARQITISSACPSLALAGSATYSTMSNNFKFSEYNWFPYSMVALSLNVPITSWASTSYKLKQNKLNVMNLQDQKLDLERNLRAGLINNINAIEKAKEDYLSNSETVKQAERAYEICQKQYEVGMATWLDLSSMELALTSSRLSYYQAVYSYMNALADLEELMGVE